MRYTFSFLITLMCLLVSAQFASCQTKTVNTSDDVILHAWCWSFNTIKENLDDIAAAGYTVVQTSPAQHCVIDTKGDEGGGNQLYGHGRWYYQYQPIDWQIGNYQLGTRDQLAALCQAAAARGIRIIVDVVPNHTAVDDSRVEEGLNAAVGGHDKLYHRSGFNEIRDYNERLQCTTGQMGGLPDVNTENPDFQVYFLRYLNDLIRCGVRGFRYDTAKHIGLPSDPCDSLSERNNFWEVMTGRERVKGEALAMPEKDLFIYGEVLQDRNVKEEEYSHYMRLTASSLGYALRNDLKNASWKPVDAADFHHPVKAEKLVTWVESHDTYCNEHESASLSDEQIRLGWVFLVSRAYGTPLFYSRPDGSDGPKGNYWGNNLVGKRGSDAFKHPLVVAANKFRHAMKGQPETVTFGHDGKIAQVCRGTRGAALINLSDEKATLSFATTLSDGTYTDELTGLKFTVNKGVIQGEMPASSAVLLAR